MMGDFHAARILIVDDEERNRKLLDVFVKADGHVPISASDGKACITYAVDQQPDLILLDLMMPDMDGFDVVRLLKNNPRTSGIPIIVVTALQDVSSHRRMLASGVDEFINKPVDRWELSLRISRLLKRDPPSGLSGTNGPTGSEA